MTNKLTDIEWISIQLDDIAVLLRTHGIEALANQLDECFVCSFLIWGSLQLRL